MKELRISGNMYCMDYALRRYMIVLLEQGKLPSRWGCWGMKYPVQILVRR